MNYKEPEQLTATIISEYYHGNRAPLLGKLHPHTVLISLGKGQEYHGAEAIRANFGTADQLGLRYEITESSCEAYPIAADSCYVVLSSTLLTFLPNGDMQRIEQRLTAIWRYFSGEETLQREGLPEEGWYFLHAHVSMAQEAQNANAFPAHLSEALYQDLLDRMEQEGRLNLKDNEGITHYVQTSHIIRFESSKNDKGKRCTIVHVTGEEPFAIQEKMDALEEIMGAGFMRIGRMHLVALSFVKQARDRKAIMADGAELPISKQTYPLFLRAMSD